MKFFISHSSQNKPTIKAIIERMPLNIKTWIDEDKLIWGSDLYPAFENAIKEESDYVILFISQSAAYSQWVHREIEWAMAKEKKLNRTIILPVCIQSGEEDCSALFPQLNDRKKMILRSFDELGLERFAKEFANYLFSFICSELSEIHTPSRGSTLRTINSADAIISEHSRYIRQIVFYHRENNPITVDALYDKLIQLQSISLDRSQFEFILDQVSIRGMIPGLYFDGYELYLQEEHMAWKKEMAHEAKVAIAKRAAAMIKNHMRIYIDAGSTTAEIVKIICNRIQSNNLYNLTIVTISISHANAIAECCVSKGFDDTNSNIRLELVGGQIRHNTVATIPVRDSEKLSDQFDYFDLGFLGVNGATAEGFTVPDNAEYRRKHESLMLSRQKVLLCDSSKCGICLRGLLCGPEDEFTVIMNRAQDNKEFEQVYQVFQDRIRLV